MKLVDKFDDALEHSTPVRFALRCEQIADEYAVDFAEWLSLNEYWWNRKEKKYKKMFINESFYFTTKELLEIYKKEKQL